MAPKFSIIVPTYNRLADLERMLKSVFDQTVSDWELLIVDNHSTDGTAALVTGLGDRRIQLLSVHNNGVIAVSRNAGIAAASGEYIAFLDSDDWWLPDKLRRVAEAFDAGADVVYHDLFTVRSAAQKRFRPGGSVRPLRSPAAIDMLSRGNALVNSGTSVRTSTLRASGPLNEDVELVGIEDFEGWLRLAAVTERFVLLDETLGFYWLGGGNMTNPQRTLKGLAAFERLYGPALDRLPAAGRPVWFQYSRARAYYALGDFARARSILRTIKLLSLPPMLFLKVSYMRLSTRRGSR